jgi:23S rRNA-/tRNA-specific pseudouridylate synthase
LPGAREARLSYRRLRVIEERVAQPPSAVPARLRTADGGYATWLEIELETGRKHQIRLQLAHHGHPIVGDRKYGSRRPFAAGIALHARRLAISHPTTGDRVQFEAPLPESWHRFGIE